MNYLPSIALALLIPFYGLSQEADSVWIKPKQGKVFNWGAKIGFNSVLPVINSFIVDNVEIGKDNRRVEYSVGYMGALFCRLNFDRFFIQPGLSLHKNVSDIYFRFPEESDVSGSLNEGSLRMDKRMNLRMYSADLPIMIGYSVIKEAPFGLSVMAGGKFRYGYKYNIRYTSSTNFREEYVSDDNRFRVNLVGGVGVTLWQLFFDFTYEVGLNHRESKFKEVNDNQFLPTNLILDKRLNMMGFSLGFLF